MDELLQDLRYTIRTLIRTPAFMAVAVLTLALGIGANTAVFSVINTVLLRPLPYEDAGRLALIWTNFGPDLPQNWVSGPELAEMRELNTTFEEIGVVVPTTVSVTEGGDPEQVGAAGVSGNFFSVLKVEAAMGRSFVAEDDVPGAAPVVMLSDGFWRRRYGGDAGVLGQTIFADGQSYTVVGVLPPGFKLFHPDLQFPQTVDLWVPVVPVFGVDYAQWQRGNHGLRAFGRMKQGVSLERAQEDMHAVATQMQELSPDYYDFDGWNITTLSLHADLVEDVKPALLVLLGAVAFVLLIACANVANLQLTRAAAREREIAVRTAVGAGRGRLVRQFITESVVLSLIGGVFGLLGAFGLVRSLVALAPDTLPRRTEIAIDGGVLGFTLLIAIVTGVLFGLAPVFYSLKDSLVESLKEGGKGSGSGMRSGRLRSGLVVTEVALALVLLIGAGLMIKSFRLLQDSDPGFDAENVITMRVSLPQSKYSTPAEVSQFFDQLIDRTEALPGVISAGTISHLPLSGAYASGTTRVNESEAQPEDEWAFEAERRWVSSDYFRTMGVEFMRGRPFTELDNVDSRPVAIVDEEFVRRFWPNENPLGKMVSINRDAEGERVWREIVGVVRHSKHYNLQTVGREQAYYPYKQIPVNTMFLAARVRSNPASLAASIRNEVWAIDPDQPVSQVRTMSELVDSSVSQPRFNLLLFGAFGAIALLLAAVGIYGVIAYSVSQRSHEIGVRMALGAAAGSVLSLVLRQGLAVASIGLVIGLAAATGLSRLLSGMLYAVSPIDPATYIGVAVALAVVAAAACSVPALRASRLDPVEVLRRE